MLARNPNRIWPPSDRTGVASLSELCRAVLHDISVLDRIRALNLPKKIVLLDVNKTLIKDGAATALLEGEAKRKLSSAIALLEAKGITVGWCSDSPILSLQLLQSWYGGSGPLVGESGKVVFYKDNVVQTSTLADIDKIKGEIRDVAGNLGLNEIEARQAPEYGGAVPSKGGNQWYFGEGRVSTVSVFGPAKLIIAINAALSSTSDFVIDSKPRHGFLAIHPGEPVKASTLVLLKKADVEDLTMVGDSRYDFVPVESGICTAFVGNADVTADIRSKAYYNARYHYYAGVVEILERIYWESQTITPETLGKVITPVTHVRARVVIAEKAPKVDLLPPHLISYSTPCQDYAPVSWVAPEVAAYYAERGEQLPKVCGRPIFKSLLAEVYDAQGYLINPVGRTNKEGLWGFYYFGPNLVALAVLTRQRSAGSPHEVLLVQNRRTSKFGLPGGFFNPGETAVAALHREIEEETGISCDFRKSHLLHAGYVDSARNTDRSWMEQVMVHQEFNYDTTLGWKFQPRDTDEIVQVAWFSLSMEKLPQHLIYPHAEFLNWTIRRVSKQRKRSVA